MFQNIKITIDNSFYIEQELYNIIHYLSEDNFDEVKNDIINLMNHGNYFKYMVEHVINYILRRRINNPYILLLSAYVYKECFIEHIELSKKLKFVYINHKQDIYEISSISDFSIIKANKNDIIRVMNKDNKILFEIKDLSETLKIKQSALYGYVYFSDNNMFNITNIDYNELKESINEKLIIHFDFKYCRNYFELVEIPDLILTIKNDDIDKFIDILTKEDDNIYYMKIQNIDINLIDLESMDLKVINKFSNGFNLIELAELYGAIKIFKYLYLLNKFDISFSNEYYIIFGGNIEILKIVENNEKIDYFITLYAAITMKRNEIIYYCLEKIPKLNKLYIIDIIEQAALNYNHDGFIMIMEYIDDNNYLNDFDEDDIKEIIYKLWECDYETNISYDKNTRLSFIIYFYNNYNEYVLSSIISMLNDSYYLNDEIDELPFNYKKSELKNKLYEIPYFMNTYYDVCFVDDNLINWIINNLGKNVVERTTDKDLINISNYICEEIENGDNYTEIHKFNYIEQFKIRLLYDIIILNNDIKIIRYYLKLLFNKEYIDEIDFGYSFLSCYTFALKIFESYCSTNVIDIINLFSDKFYNKYRYINTIISQSLFNIGWTDIDTKCRIKYEIIKYLHEQNNDEAIRAEWLIIDEIDDLRIYLNDGKFDEKQYYFNYKNNINKKYKFKFNSTKYFNIYINYLITTYNIKISELDIKTDTIFNEYIKNTHIDKEVLNLLMNDIYDDQNLNFINEYLDIL